MNQQHAKAGVRLNTIAYYIFLVIMTIASLGLVYYSGFYSTFIDTRYYEIATPHRDSIWVNLLCFIAGVLLLILIAKLLKKIGKYGNLALLGILIVVMSIFSCWIIGFSHSVPCADQYSTLYSGVDLVKNNYSSMQEGGYLYIYPHQIGFALYGGLFSKLFPNSFELAIQYANVIWNALTLIIGYRLMAAFTNNTKAKTYFLLLMTGFLPLFIYVPFIYGEMIMVALSLLLALLTLRFIQTQKWYYAVCAVLCSFLLVAFRMNSLIPVLACTIALVLAALKKDVVKNLIVALLVFLAGATSLNVLHGIYSAKSGLEFNEGVPMVAHVAVGLQDCISSPGWSNNWNLTTYIETGYSEEETEKLSVESIRTSLGNFKNDLGYTWDFFSKKFSSQWNEPSFSVFQMVNYTETEHSKTYDDFYYGRLNTNLLAFMDQYLFIVYVLLLIFLLYGFRHRDYDISQMVLLIAAFGGMLFHMIWEGKSRYTMPFFAVMIPYMALGMINIEFYFDKICGKIKELRIKNIKQPNS